MLVFFLLFTFSNCFVVRRFSCSAFLFACFPHIPVIYRAFSRDEGRCIRCPSLCVLVGDVVDTRKEDESKANNLVYALI